MRQRRLTRALVARVRIRVRRRLADETRLPREHDGFLDLTNGRPDAR